MAKYLLIILQQYWKKCKNQCSCNILCLYYQCGKTYCQNVSFVENVANTNCVSTIFPCYCGCLIQYFLIKEQEKGNRLQQIRKVAHNENINKRL